MQRYNSTMALSLTSRERARLKSRAHAIEPIVQVGQGGVSDAVVVELDRALTAHELIKVKINGTDRDARHAIAEDVCTRTGAAAVQQVGKILVLWRPKPEDGAGTRPASE